jgi:hypothetical protein
MSIEGKAFNPVGAAELYSGFVTKERETARPCYPALPDKQNET